MAQQYIYHPSFDHSEPAPKPKSPEPTKPDEYYRYDAGNAGRLTSALPTYQQAYVPTVAYPVSVVYAPVVFQTPNVPAHCVPAFFAENAHTAPVFMSYPAPSSPHKASVPSGVAWHGSTKAEVDMQNRAIHHSHAKPRQLAPYEPATHDQFWCRELDGSYTLRTEMEIQKDVGPGYWQAGKKGIPYYIRQPK
ncbi:hypothetical protein MMC10_005614 [Thelotrema lepadinum]|nr:hypothetical protein [Thelotrema lepadinum]